MSSFHLGSSTNRPESLSSAPKTRSIDQNKLMWALLGDIGRQVNWHGQHLAPEEWKCVLTAALKRQKVVPGIDGGFVVIGQSTSKMTKQELSEVIELAYAFGAERDVVWTDSERRAA